MNNCKDISTTTRPMAEPLMRRLARAAFRRRCAEVGEARALAELDASFDRTLDQLGDQGPSRAREPHLSRCAKCGKPERAWPLCDDWRCPALLIEREIT